MDRELYTSLAQRATELVEAGQHTAALDVLEHIIAGDLPDFDKAMMCLNTAIVHDRQGEIDAALGAYARAMDYERGTGSCYVEQHRAAYLAQLGRFAESLRCYEDLLRRDDLTPEQRTMFERNVATLAQSRER